MNTLEQNRKDVYNDILGDIAHDLLIFGEQLRLKVYNLINSDYDAQEHYPLEKIEKIVSKKLNKTSKEDLVKLRELYNLIDETTYLYFNKSEEYFSNKKDQK